MRYTFGDYELDTQLFELRQAGKPLKIEPQVFNVLAYLVQHHDRTVTREELLMHLWPEQFTTESVLSYCIMTARRAVGDSGREQRIIKTVHGRGFRFVAQIDAHDHAAQKMHTPPATSAPPRQTPSREEVHTLPSSRAPEQARTQVTVLCATLANATTLGEQLGFNALQRLRQAFFAQAQDQAQRYAGTLQFFGADGILILFGAPVVCEAHARQAILAALELQRRLGEQHAEPTAKLAVRMGLHTGPVAIDSIPNDQRIAPTEMGETMHLALWLQYLAESGTLLISEATRQLAPETAQDATPRDLHVPGHVQPVRAYTLREP